MDTLETRFSRFIRLIPTVRVLDELPQVAGKGRIADYLAFDESLIAEQKTVNKDQAHRVQSIVDRYSAEDFYPQFYGTRTLDSILKEFPNAAEVGREIYSEITNVLEGYLSEAKRQINSTARILSIENPCGLLIILNDRVKVLSPEVVVTRIQQRLGEKNADGKWRYADIPYALYICETHLFRGTTPCCYLIDGPHASLFKPHRECIDYIVASWSAMCGGSVLNRPATEAFSELHEREDALPERLTKSQRRELWYKSNRYMESWSDDRVLAEASKYIARIAPYFLKGGPKPTEDVAEQTLQFSDFIHEFNERGLDLRDLSGLRSANE